MFDDGDLPDVPNPGELDGELGEEKLLLPRLPEDRLPPALAHAVDSARTKAPNKKTTETMSVNFSLLFLTISLCPPACGWKSAWGLFLFDRVLLLIKIENLLEKRLSFVPGALMRLVTAVVVLPLIRRGRPLKVAFLIIRSRSLRIECHGPLDYFVRLISVEPNASAIGTAIDLDSLTIHRCQFLAANRALHFQALRDKCVECFPFRVSSRGAP
jgi:hypothetical protein